MREDMEQIIAAQPGVYLVDDPENLVHKVPVLAWSIKPYANCSGFTVTPITWEGDPSAWAGAPGGFIYAERPPGSDHWRYHYGGTFYTHEELQSQLGRDFAEQVRWKSQAHRRRMESLIKGICEREPPHFGVPVARQILSSFGAKGMSLVPDDKVEGVVRACLAAIDAAKKEKAA
jgi:hypothetical protein